FAAAFNAIVMPWLGCDTTCSYSDVKALFPALPTVQSNADKSLTVSLQGSQGLVSQYDSLVATTRTGTESDITDLKSVSDYQIGQGFPDNPSISPLPPGNTDNPAQRQALRQLQLDAAQSTISGIATLVGLANPQLGNQIQTVGSATVQIGEAVSKYLNTVETLGTGLAGAALTGNIIQAAVGIFSLFSPSGGPSPDQIILQEIQQLSQQIEELHQDMNNRF